MLPNEATRWVELEFISHEQKEKILNHYKKTENSKAAYLAFSIVGALFIGVGVISIIAHNWDNLSKISRFILGILPLVFAQIIGFYVLKNRPQSKAWIEGVGIFWFLTFGVALTIIGQTYHLGSSVRDFYLAWMVMMFPVLFLLKSDWVGLFIICLLNLWFSEVEYSNITDVKPIFLALFALWLVYYFYKIKFYRHLEGVTLLSYALVFTFLFNLTNFLPHGEFLQIYTYVYVLTIFYYVDYLFFANLSFWQKPFGIVSKLGLTVVILMGVGESDFSKAIELMHTHLAIYTTFSLLALAGFIYLFIKEKNTDILYPLVPILLWLFSLHISISPFYSILLAFILGFMIYHSSFKGEILKANFAMTILLIGLFIEFARNNLGFITQGVAFIVLGVCFLYMNVFIKKRRKA